MTSATRPEPLPTPAEMAQADAQAARNGTPTLTLMRNAARATARAAGRMGPARTLVLTGPGSNGGDGWGAACLLAQRGWPVAVAEWAPPPPNSAAAALRAEWHGPRVPFTPDEAARATLVIDAVFGAGLRDHLPARVAETLAAAPRILAIDVPSGLDGATGQPRGRVHAAERTITFAARKARPPPPPRPDPLRHRSNAPTSASPPPRSPPSTPGATPPPSGASPPPTPFPTNTPAATSPSWAAPP